MEYFVLPFCLLFLGLNLWSSLHLANCGISPTTQNTSHVSLTNRWQFSTSLLHPISLCLLTAFFPAPVRPHQRLSHSIRAASLHWGPASPGVWPLGHLTPPASSEQLPLLPLLHRLLSLSQQPKLRYWSGQTFVNPIYWHCSLTTSSLVSRSLTDFITTVITDHLQAMPKAWCKVWINTDFKWFTSSPPPIYF